MRYITLLLTIVLAFAAYAQPRPENKHALPFFASADSSAQSFARIINRSGRAGTVRIYAISDSGERRGPVELSIDASKTTHFNSQDLEHGNPAKGLSDGVGDGQGHWWLELHTTLDVEALGYVRTPDGFLTEMHSVVPLGEDGRYDVLFFNPASNQNVSRLRIVNPNPERVAFTIRALDDDGMREVEPFQFAHSCECSQDVYIKPARIPLRRWRGQVASLRLRGPAGLGHEPHDHSERARHEPLATGPRSGDFRTRASTASTAGSRSCAGECSGVLCARPGQESRREGWLRRIRLSVLTQWTLHCARSRPWGGAWRSLDIHEGLTPSRKPAAQL